MGKVKMFTCHYPRCSSKKCEGKTMCKKHHVLVNVLLPEMKGKKKHENAKIASASTILGFFREAISNPSYKMCCDRLKREFLQAEEI